MNIDRRDLAVPVGAAGLLAALPRETFAANAEDPAVRLRVEAFRDAQQVKDTKTLTAMTMPELSDSRADAHIEDQSTFVKNATSTKSNVVSIDYSDIRGKVVGDAALVCFPWTSESESVADGKHSSANLHDLVVWTKAAGVWKLLGRCSTKLA